MKVCKRNYYYKLEDKRCPPCKKIDKKNWDEANKEKKSLYRKNHYIANKKQSSINSKIYRRDNLDKRSAWESKRRATKINATPKWLNKDQLMEIRSYYTISKSLEKTNGIKYQVDHIVPFQNSMVCGLHVPWNLRVITAQQNLSKHNKLLEI